MTQIEELNAILDEIEEHLQRAIDGHPTNEVNDLVVDLLSWIRFKRSTIIDTPPGPSGELLNEWRSRALRAESAFAVWRGK